MVQQFESAPLKGEKKAPCNLKASLLMTLPGLFALKSAPNGETIFRKSISMGQDRESFLNTQK